MCWRFIRLRSCFCELSGTSTKPHAYLRSRSVRLGSSLICAPYLFKGHAFRVDSGLTVRRALFAVRRSCDAEHRRGCRAPPRRYFVTLESSTPYGYDLNTHSAEPANQRNPGDTHGLSCNKLMGRISQMKDLHINRARSIIRFRSTTRS